MNDHMAYIRYVEELSLNAWPALRTTLLDGWVLRFSDGYTRRANCVNPLYPGSGTATLEQHVDRCEELYARVAGQAVVFKITEAAPEGLDDLLAARGYRREAETSVQVREITEDHAVDLLRPGMSINVVRKPTEAWIGDFLTMTGTDPAHRPAMERMLHGIVAPAVGFASVRVQNETVAVGLAVAERGHVGLFDIATAPAWRRRGIGTALVQFLQTWGGAAGAQRAYLQVMRENTAAVGLYEKLGFAEVYRYWYRVRAADDVTGSPVIVESRPPEQRA